MTSFRTGTGGTSTSRGGVQIRSHAPTRSGTDARRTFLSPPARMWW
jgi:hypothetical protein